MESMFVILAAFLWKQTGSDATTQLVPHSNASFRLPMNQFPVQLLTAFSAYIP